MSSERFLVRPKCIRLLDACRHLHVFHDTPRSTNWVRLVASDLSIGCDEACTLCLLISAFLNLLSPSLTPEECRSTRELSEFRFKSNSTASVLGVDCIIEWKDSLDNIPKMILINANIFAYDEGRSIMQDALLDCDRTLLTSSLSIHRWEMPQSQPLSDRLDLDKVTKIIKRWVENCINHCEHDASPASPSLPTRILDIGQRNADAIKLLITNGMCAPYVALSYCWGSDGAAISLTTTSCAQISAGIKLDMFPPMFQDAIAICRAIEIRYLWIDALCIVQDDPEDWEAESARMKEVYQNAYLTIAASKCANTQTRLLSNRWTTFHAGNDPKPIVVPLRGSRITCQEQQLAMQPQKNLAHDRTVTQTSPQRHAEDAPLLKRAWAFQERLLSTRMVHFQPEELVWECCTGYCCECAYLDNQTTLRRNKNPDDYFFRKSSFATLDVERMAPLQLFDLWSDIVHEYSQLDLTFENDRLAALSGVAAKFKHTSLGKYLCGIWEGSVGKGLLYWPQLGTLNTCSESRDVFPALAASYSPPAPSWSWASVSLEGSTTISYSSARSSSISPHFEYVGFRGDLIGTNEFGWVRDGVLTVRGKFAQCTICTPNDSGPWFWWYAEGKRPGPDKVELVWTANLHNDRRIPLHRGDKLFALIVSQQWGLALSAVPGKAAYRRVGILELPGGAELESCAKVQQIDII